jgi:LPS-assembly protein
MYSKAIIFLIRIFLLLFMTVHNLMAEDVNLSKGSITIDAASIAYDKEEDTFDAKGDVVITFSQGYLMADSVILNRKTSDAFAQGNVMVMSEGDLLEGDRIRFDIDTKTGVVYEGNMFFEKNHFYIKGSKIVKKKMAVYRVEDAVATTCDGDSPDWRLTGRELNVTVDGFGSMKDGKFLIKDFPVFYTPYMLFPAKTTRQSGFLFPQFSYSQNKFGLDIELPFFWAISESTDATFYQRYMEKRGFKEGLELRYYLSKDSFGTFYGDFMNDTGPPADSPDGIGRNWQSAQNRWSLYLNHETAFDPSFYLRTDIRKVSDRWYFKDFSTNNYYRDNYSETGMQRFQKVSFFGDESLASLESTVRLVKNWQLYNLTALVSDTNNLASVSNDATLQRYPEITLTGLKRPLFGTPLNLEFSTTYDYYYRAEGQRGHLYDFQPVFSLPFNVRDYLQLTPQMSMKETYWNRDDNTYTTQSKQGNRMVYNVGANLATELHRIFDVGGERIDKLRHGIRPEVTYTYIPNTSQDDIPDFVLKVPEQHTLTYALTNTVLAKLKEKGGGKSYQEVLRFKISQTYDMIEGTRGDIAVPSREKRPFSDIAMELDVKPLQYVSFSARNKYSVYLNDWSQTNYDLNLNDSRGDTATIGYRYARSMLDEIIPSGSITPFSPYRYTQSPLEEINLSLKAVIMKSLDITYLLRRNELDKKTLESTYGLNYRKQCWGVDILFSESQTDRSFTVLFSLYGLGKIGSSATTAR